MAGRAIRTGPVDNHRASLSFWSEFLRRCSSLGSKQEGLYQLVDVVGATPVCYALWARDCPAQRHQAPATRAHFHTSSERAFPTRGELWEKGGSERKAKRACH